MVEFIPFQNLFDLLYAIHQEKTEATPRNTGIYHFIVLRFIMCHKDCIFFTN